MRGGDYWSIDYFVKNQLYFHSLLNDYVVDYVVDYVLKIWAHLFYQHSPSILCMNSKVTYLFITQDNVSIQTTITSLSRPTYSFRPSAMVLSLKIRIIQNTGTT